MSSSKETPRWKKIIRTIGVLVIIGFLAIWLANFKPKTQVLPFDPSVLKITKIDTVVFDLPIGKILTSVDSTNGNYKTTQSPNCGLCDSEKRNAYIEQCKKNRDTVCKIFNKKLNVTYVYVERN